MHLKWGIFLTHLTARDNQVAVSSPQLCVGFLFLILYPGLLLLRLPPPLSHTLTHSQLCHIASLTYNNFTYNNFTHTQTHTQLCQTSHTMTSHTLTHTQLCHIASLTYNNFTHTHTHNFVTYHLSHNFVTYNLSHTITSHTNLTYNNFTYTHTHTHTRTHFTLCHMHTHSHTHTQTHTHTYTYTYTSHFVPCTNSHLPSFCVAGVAQTHIYHRFAWQAWH